MFHDHFGGQQAIREYPLPLGVRYVLYLASDYHTKGAVFKTQAGHVLCDRTSISNLKTKKLTLLVRYGTEFVRIVHLEGSRITDHRVIIKTN